MNRRDLILQTTGTVALGFTAAAEAFAADKAVPSGKNADSNPYAKLIESSNACIKTGHACIAHCQKELAAGNKIMAECLKGVLDLVAACETLEKLALYESPYLKDFAKVTAKICGDCAKLCEKHINHSDICKACMDACKDCEKNCQAATA